MVTARQRGSTGWLRLWALFAAVAALTAAAARASGPGIEDTDYANPTCPSHGIDAYIAGELGTLDKDFSPEILVPAFRHLSGLDMGQANVHELLKTTTSPVGRGVSWSEAVEAWKEARRKVHPQAPDIQALSWSDSRNERVVVGDHEISQWFPNCFPDAALTATRTLTSRAAEHGADSPWVRSWIEAQDQVFSNCRSGQTIPAPLPPEAPAWARFDRAYQIASARFYSSQLDEAERQFAAIAADPASPWSGTARYLILRCKVRRATLGPGEERDARLRSAEDAIRAHLAQRSDTDAMQRSAEGLLRFVRALREPDTVRRELASALLEDHLAPETQRILRDYAHVLYPLRCSVEGQEPPALEKLEELTAWILAMRNPSVYAPDSRVRWETTGHLRWLVAALEAPRGTQGLERALDAVETMPESSPAFLTCGLAAGWHYVAAKRIDAASRMLARLERALGSKAPVGEQNRVADLRAQIATRIKDWVMAKAQHPVSQAYGCGGGVSAADVEPGAVWLSSPAGPIANRWLDARRMAALAEDRSLPGNIRREFVLAAWTRHVLLRHDRAAEALVPLVSELVPELDKQMAVYKAATKGSARRFSAALILLRHPGLTPFLVGDGATNRSYHDIVETPGFRWCGGENALFGRGGYIPNEGIAPPLWVDAPLTGAVLAERERAKALEGAPIDLGRMVLDWARAHIKDPLVPEALHLVVRSTRVGCDGGRGREVAKPAFELLHRRYPSSQWARKTPYWYD